MIIPPEESPVLKEHRVFIQVSKIMSWVTILVKVRIDSISLLDSVCLILEEENSHSNAATIIPFAPLWHAQNSTQSPRKPPTNP